MSKEIPLTCRYFQEGWGLGKMDNVFHVIPVNELNEHMPTIKCACHPKMEIVPVMNENNQAEDHYFVMHNSYLLAEIKKSQNN